MRIALDVEPAPPRLAWLAQLTAEDLRSLGPALHEVEELSVVLVAPPFSIEGGVMTFNRRAAVLLNKGRSERVLFLAPQPAPSTVQVQGGDAQFLAALPASLADVGRALLAEVRENWPGQLRPTQTSGKYVESPDNFWTVKIQPRDGSLALTIRGEPERYRDFDLLGLKRDQNGYSRFKIRTISQIPEVLRLLKQVPRRS